MLAAPGHGDAGKISRPLAWLHMEGTPLNKFKTTGLASICFPTLFPYGRGDPTNPGRKRTVSPTGGVKDFHKYFSGDSDTRRPFLLVHGEPAILALVPKHAGPTPDAQPDL